MTTKLSEHFTLEEACITSHRGVDNTPPMELSTVLINTAKGMERVRACLGDKPITISSWYRCPVLNILVGSRNTSQHLKGEAVDWICPAFGAPLQIVKHLVENDILIRFDQLILEHSWIHISFVSPIAKPRNEVLTLLKNGTYAKGITDINGVPK